MSYTRYHCFYIINDTNVRLKKMITSVEKLQASIDEAKAIEISDLVYEMINGMEEAKSIFNSAKVLTYDQAQVNVRQALDQLMENYEDKAVFLSSLVRITNFADMTVTDMGSYHNTNDHIYKTYAIGEDFSILDKLRSIYPTKSRPLTMFYANVNMRPSSIDMCIYNKMNKTFDLENYVQVGYNSYGYKEAMEKKAERVTESAISDMRISNRCFDMLYIPYDFDVALNVAGAKGDQIINKNRNIISMYEKYLRPGGTFFTLMPSYGLTKEYVYQLTKYFDTIHFAEYMAGHDGMRPFYLVTGIKKETDFKVDYNYASNVRCSHYDKTLEEDTWPEEQIKVLPYVEIEMFRSINLEDEDIEQMVEMSGLINHVIETQGQYQDKDDMRPLLPFNTGQIGLVLASGQLDGIVEEKDGHVHVIKGRIVRTNDDKGNDEDEEEGTMIQSVVSSSKVQINLFLPNGDYKSIA